MIFKWFFIFFVVIKNHKVSLKTLKKHKIYIKFYETIMCLMCFNEQTTFWEKSLNNTYFFNVICYDCLRVVVWFLMCFFYDLFFYYHVLFFSVCKFFGIYKNITKRNAQNNCKIKIIQKSEIIKQKHKKHWKSLKLHKFYDLFMVFSIKLFVHLNKT